VRQHPVPEAPQRPSIAPAAGNHSPLDYIQHEIEILSHIFCKKAQNEKAILLEQLVLSAITPVCLNASQMLRTVQFYGQAPGPPPFLSGEQSMNIESMAF
jgi:hypothetical protein